MAYKEKTTAEDSVEIPLSSGEKVFGWVLGAAIAIPLVSIAASVIAGL